MLNLPITTSRLRIRRFRSADAAHFHALRLDPELARFQGWSTLSVDAARAFVEEMATAPWPGIDDWLQLVIATTDDDTPIGDIGVAVRADSALELGITLARPWQRQGLAREALAAVLEAVAAQGLADTARGVIDARNAASAAMLRALGFVRTAIEPVQWRGEAIEEWQFERRLAGQAAPHRRLHGRLAGLADSLAAEPQALGLLALGSVGAEVQRLDAWSDLDFFVLVRDAATKARFVASLDWLEAAHPLAWHFANTVDGHKALMADGVLCEFAVFTPQELRQVPYAPGRWVWRRAEVPADWAAPALPLPAGRDTAWRVAEALSNLLVGLMRHARGERLAAMRLVQVHALDRVLELMAAGAPASPDATPPDPFSPERRAEQRLPAAAAGLSTWAGGYDATPTAALALLAWLEQHHEVPAAVAAHIRALARALADPAAPPA